MESEEITTLVVKKDLRDELKIEAIKRNIRLQDFIDEILRTYLNIKMD